MDPRGFPYQLAQVVGYLARLGLARGESIGADLKNWVAVTRCHQLIAEHLPLSSLADADHTDAKFLRTPRV